MEFINKVQHAQTKFKGHNVRIKDWSFPQAAISILK